MNEARERASKALGFTKKLRNDLENAAKFSIDIGSACLLAKLKATEHVQVNKPVSQSCTEHSSAVPKRGLASLADSMEEVDVCGKKKCQNGMLAALYIFHMPSKSLKFFGTSIASLQFQKQANYQHFAYYPPCHCLIIQEQMYE